MTTVQPFSPPPESFSAFEAAIGDREFERLQGLIEREAGIRLGPTKRALLVGRLGRRLHELSMTSFREYCAKVESDPAERVEMLDRIATNETHFFREQRHFDLLSQEILPRWHAEAERGLRPRKISVWSAACSTGEEPFTLAMVLLRAFPPGTGWSIAILASDISTRVLRAAREAVWPIARAAEIPEPELKRFMLKGVGDQEGLMRAGPELREVVRFARVNLVEPYPALGTLDLVFCRNVLIYFDVATKHAVVSRLLDHLAPDGYLFLGHAESLAGSPLHLQTVSPSVYRRPGASEGGR
ncbi:MAG TPA: protein-glutamate O-methyltransferase [Anaeromyxobacter sp.]|nr:protein-glutamate O-methyltransferase [Anaeromyxobacter sp.]